MGALWPGSGSVKILYNLVIKSFYYSYHACGDCNWQALNISLPLCSYDHIIPPFIISLKGLALTGLHSHVAVVLCLQQRLCIIDLHYNCSNDQMFPFSLVKQENLHTVVALSRVSTAQTWLRCGNDNDFPLKIFSSLQLKGDA